MTGWARAVDANQSDIIAVLQAAGATVRTLQLEAQGIPDLLCGFREVNYLMEVKTMRGKLNPRQVQFFETWQGQKAVVRSVEDALGLIGVQAAPVDYWSRNVAQTRGGRR